MFTTNPKQDQRGMAHVLMVVLVLVVVGVIGFAGWKVAGGNKKASTVTSTTTKDTEKVAADSGCVAAYHDENLCKFSTNADIEKLAYTATLTSTDTDGTAGTFTLKSDGKGNSSMSGLLNTVQLDGASYIKNGNVWYKYPASSDEEDDSDPTADMNLVLGEGITYKPQGKEACGSRTCFKYEVTETASPETTQFVWFDTKDYLLRQWKSTGADGSALMTLEYGNVKISAPSPVQDA